MTVAIVPKKIKNKAVITKIKIPSQTKKKKSNKDLIHLFLAVYRATYVVHAIV